MSAAWWSSTNMVTLPLRATDNLRCSACWHVPAVGRSAHHGCFPSSPAESPFQKKKPSPSQINKNNRQLQRKGALVVPASPGTYKHKHLGTNINLWGNTSDTAPVTTFSDNMQHSSVVLSSWVVLFCSQRGGVLPVEDESHVQPRHNSS